MRESNRTNLSAIALFDQSLDKYEEVVALVSGDPIQYTGPTQYLQTALNRLLAANIPDGFQMMRSLATRMIKYSETAYSEYTLLLVSSGSVSTVFKDEIIAIAYKLLECIRGNDPVLDQSWRDRINGNSSIEAFLTHFKTSDQPLLKTAHPGNCIIASPTVKETVSPDPSVTLGLGKQDQLITLSSTDFQTLQFALGEGWVDTTGYRSDLPRIFTTSVSVKCGIGQFFIPKSVKLTETAKAIASSLGCISEFSSTAGSHNFKLPGSFFSCKLDLLSIDSGGSWVITNIQILPPSVRGI